MSSVEVEASNTKVLVAETCLVAVPLLPFTTAVIAPDAINTEVLVVATANIFDPIIDCTCKLTMYVLPTDSVYGERVYLVGSLEMERTEEVGIALPDEL